MTDDDMIPAAADFLNQMIELEASFLDRWAGNDPALARAAALLGLYCFFGDARERVLKGLSAYVIEPEMENAVWDKLEEGMSDDFH